MYVRKMYLTNICCEIVHEEKIYKKTTPIKVCIYFCYKLKT